VISQMAKVAAEQHLDSCAADRRPSASQLWLGLAVFFFAILVARLEDEIGSDPFSESPAKFPKTVGESILLYVVPMALAR
jgi:hypothetical protein